MFARMSDLKIIMRAREAAMNVKSILAAKKRNLGGDIVTIEPTANLAAAAKLLSAHRIGAVLIRGPGGRLAGILSERDIVRALSEHDADALALPVGQVMTREVATCGEDDSCRQHHGAHDDGKIPSPAGHRQWSVGGPCLDRRRGQATRRGGRERIRGDARLHPDRVSVGASLHRWSAATARQQLR